MSKWWHDHGRLLAALAIALTVAGTALLPLLIIRMPADYFTRTDPPPRRGLVPNARRARLAALALKNIVGLTILVLGLVMSLPLVPGPGILAMILGLSLMNFPGKRRLELSLVKLPGVLAAINATRRRFGHAPLVLS